MNGHDDDLISVAIGRRAEELLDEEAYATLTPENMHENRKEKP